MVLIRGGLKSTWDCVIQYETKETSNKHTGCQKDLQHLVKFNHTWKQDNEKICITIIHIFLIFIHFVCLILSLYSPVAIASGCFNIQLGMTKAENMEKPKTKMLRDEFISAY